ncbi:MAG: hypothetical protein M1834_008508 [Cirrosporium novae-zelandiae]|nr:MAG: hypothetical protein M1834_008508 [Cirrosporium novae-zelandiae]
MNSNIKDTHVVLGDSPYLLPPEMCKGNSQEPSGEYCESPESSLADFILDSQMDNTSSEGEPVPDISDGGFFDDNEWIAEIVDKREKRVEGKIIQQYLVQQYSLVESKWMPASHFKNSPELIEDFEKRDRPRGRPI